MRDTLLHNAPTIAMALVLTGCAGLGSTNGATGGALSGSSQALGAVKGAVKFAAAVSSPEFDFCMKNPGGQCQTPTAVPASSADVASGAASRANAITSGVQAEIELNCPGISKALTAKSGITEGTLTSNLSQAADLLSSSTVAQVTAAHDTVNSAGTGAGETGIDAWIDRLKMDAFALKAAHVAQQGGWTPLAVYLTCGKGGAVEAANNHDRTHLSLDRFGIYLLAYYDAYLRNGEFAQAGVDWTGLQNQLIAQMGKNPTPAAVSGVTTALNALQTKVNASGQPLSFGKVGTTGFVTRFGTTYQVQPLQANFFGGKRVFGVQKVDYIGAEAGFIRVFLEALFDATDQLPAVSNASGAAMNLKTELPRLGVNLPPATLDQVVASVALPTFQSCAVIYNNLSSDGFSDQEKIANNWETGATTLASIAARANTPATNNEALAQFIETTTGVTARKLVEKVSWCQHVCAALQPACTN